VRILVVTGLYPPHHEGGYEVACASFVAHARTKGHAVRVLATNHRWSSVADADHADVFRELRWYKDSELAFGEPTRAHRLLVERDNARTLRRHLAGHRPDAICWWALGGLSLSIIEQARWAGLPTVGIVCDEWMLWGPRVDAWQRAFANRPRLGGVAQRLTGWPTRVDLSSASSWLFVSTYLLERVTREVPLARASVAPLGIDRVRFTPRPPPPWTDRALYVGRLSPKKGVDVAVEALGRLPPTWSLDLVGPGPADYTRDLRERARRSGSEERLRMAGSRGRTDVLAAYEAADAVVFPVRWEEPWGLVPLEAMAVGRLVIATGTGGSAEYLRDEHNCLLVPREDPHALAAALQRLSRDSELRERMRRGGLETAARYDAGVCNDRFLRALGEAAGIAG